MSTDQHIYAIIGFSFTEEEINTAFMRETVSEQYHMEKVFCSKTGSRLPDKKVVDSPAKIIWSFKGKKSYTFPEALLEDLVRHLAKLTKLPVTFCVRPESADSSEQSYIIGLSFASINDYGSRCMYGNASLRLDELDDWFDKVKPIGKILSSFGLKAPAKLCLSAYFC